MCFTIIGPFAPLPVAELIAQLGRFTSGNNPPVMCECCYPGTVSYCVHVYICIYFRMLISAG